MAKFNQFSVIKDATLALRRILENGLRDCFDEQVAVLLDPPRDAKSQSGEKPALSLLLYKQERNLEHSNYDRQLCREVREDGTTYEYFRSPPLFMTLRYLVSAWWRTPDDQALIGAAARVIHDHPYVEEGDVEGGTIHLEDRPVVKISPDFSLEEHRLLMEVLDIPFRRSFACHVMVRLDSEKREDIRRVRERVTNVRKMDG